MKYYNGEEYELQQYKTAIKKFQVSFMPFYLYNEYELFSFRMDKTSVKLYTRLLNINSLIFFSFQSCEWRTQASMNLLNIFQNITITLGVLSGALLCVHYVVGKELTSGDYVLFSTYILQLYTPLDFFGTYYRYIFSCLSKY